MRGEDAYRSHKDIEHREATEDGQHERALMRLAPLPPLTWFNTQAEEPTLIEEVIVRGLVRPCSGSPVQDRIRAALAA